MVTSLAERLRIAVDDVTVVSIEGVTWPDADLGCSQPGMSYTQTLVDGSRVILKAGRMQYEYCAGPDGVIFFCADPTLPLED